MTDTDLTFSDFVTDKDGDYSKAQFMALANQLLEQGKDPRKVFLAMYRAGATASVEHSIAEHYSFIKTVAEETANYMPELDARIDQQIAMMEGQGMQKPSNK